MSLGENPFETTSYIEELDSKTVLNINTKSDDGAWICEFYLLYHKKKTEVGLKNNETVKTRSSKILYPKYDLLISSGSELLWSREIKTCNPKNPETRKNLLF